MSRLKQSVDELKKIGYTDEKIKELMELILPDLQDQLFLDLAGVTTDEEIEEFKKKVENARTKEDMDDLIEEIGKKAYGENYQQKVEEMTAEALDEVAELTKKTRKLYHDYMAGDPDTKKKFEDYEKSEEYKQLMKEMEDDGFDFRAAAAK